MVGYKDMGDGLFYIGCYPALHQGRLEEWGVYRYNEVAELENRRVIYGACEGKKMNRRHRNRRSNAGQAFRVRPSVQVYVGYFLDVSERY